MPSIEWGKMSKLTILLPTVQQISKPSPSSRPGIGGFQIWLAQIYLPIHVVRALQYVNKKTPSVAMHSYRFYILSDFRKSGCLHTDMDIHGFDCDILCFYRFFS